MMGYSRPSGRDVLSGGAELVVLTGAAILLISGALASGYWVSKLINPAAAAVGFPIVSAAAYTLTEAEPSVALADVTLEDAAFYSGFIGGVYVIGVAAGLMLDPLATTVAYVGIGMILVGGISPLVRPTARRIRSLVETRRSGGEN